MLVDSIRTFVTLREEERESYPQLAQVLDELGESMEQSTVMEFEALVVYAEEDVPTRPDRFETYIDRTDFQVRRADSTVLSLYLVVMPMDWNFPADGCPLRASDPKDTTCRLLPVSAGPLVGYLHRRSECTVLHSLRSDSCKDHR